MEEMKLFSSDLLGVVLAKKNLGFGLALAEICQSFCPATVPQGQGVLATNNLGFGLALVEMLAANNLVLAWLGPG
jgi:hypothetical protein